MGTDFAARKAGSGVKRSDPRGGHTRLYWDLQDSNAWRALSFSSQCLWLAMRRQLGKSNNGNIDATVKTLAHHQFKSSATIAKCLRELQVAGFIQKTRQGGIASGGKICSLYRFTDEAVIRVKASDVAVSEKPTNEWQQWKTIREVKAAIDSAHENARRPTTSASTGHVESKVQEMRRSAS